MADSIEAGSDAVFPLYCQPCSGEGKHLEAEGYCDDCEEHLCHTCFKYHLLPKPMKHHHLQDKSEMPQQMKGRPTVNLAMCTDMCPSHPNKVVEYFCKKDNQLGCSVCITLHHQACSKVDYIPDIVDKVEDSEELKNLRWRLELIFNTANRIRDVSKKNKIEAETYKKHVKTEIRKMTHAFTALMTKLENDINRKIDSITDQDTKLMGEAAQECAASATEAQDLIKELERREQNGQNCQLFVAMKKTEKTVKELELRTKAMSSKTMISRYKFSPDRKWQEMLSASPDIGTVTVWRNSDLKASYVRDIDINIPADTDIHGMVLLNDSYLAVCNFFSSAVELIDVDQNKLISAVSMTSPPACITVVHDDQIVVTLSTKSKLHFLSVAEGLLQDTDHDIIVDGQCFGIVSTQHHLIVSFLESFKIEILDMNGTLIRQFDYSDGDRPNKVDFTFLSISPCHDIIYVSNPGINKVISLTLDGKVIDTYNDSRLKYPAGVTTDVYGNVFVCGTASNNVHFLTSDHKNLLILLEGTGFEGPIVVCTNRLADKIFVYSFHSKKIKVYQFKI